LKATITSLQLLKTKLILIQESDPEDLKKIKNVYKEFALWFLKDKILMVFLESEKWTNDLQKLNKIIEYKNNRYMNFLLNNDRIFTNKDYLIPR
jgi:hypothetical protein